jgi:hypothetical protein
MRVSVYDTYVRRKDEGLMHFDIIVPENSQLESVLRFGQAYLKEKGQEGQQLTAKECRFCHIENAPEPMQASIREKGYFIYEMQGCQLAQTDLTQ